MNPIVKHKWLEALRSGEYEQTRGKLKDDKGFCCLGVLCDLHSKETGNEWETLFDVEVYLGIGGILPVRVCSWAELPPSKINPDVYYTNSNGNFFQTTLAELNDIYKLNFNQIADIIEEQL